MLVLDFHSDCHGRYDVNDWLSTKLQLQMASEAGMSQSMLDLEFKGSDSNAQLKFGTNEFYGIPSELDVQ
jgi:mitochondrial import receptor subunit TOM40